MTVRERMRRRGFTLLGGEYYALAHGALIRVAASGINGLVVAHGRYRYVGDRGPCHGLPDIAQRARAAARNLARKGKR